MVGFIMWIMFGIIMALLGILLMSGQNFPIALITIFGTIVEVIALMVVYIFVIAKKYIDEK